MAAAKVEVNGTSLEPGRDEALAMIPANSLFLILPPTTSEHKAETTFSEDPWPLSSLNT